MSYTYEYPRPALTVDAVIFRHINNQTEVLLIKRAHPPFQNCWAFPGGFVDEGETVEQAVARELEEETGLTGIELKQFYTASKPGRDPRGWNVSVMFTGTLKSNLQAIAADDAAEVHWFNVNKLPELAFDHSEIMGRTMVLLNEIKD